MVRHSACGEYTHHLIKKNEMTTQELYHASGVGHSKTNRCCESSVCFVCRGKRRHGVMAVRSPVAVTWSIAEGSVRTMVRGAADQFHVTCFRFFVVVISESCRNSRQVCCGGFFCFAGLATRPLGLDPLLCWGLFV